MATLKDEVLKNSGFSGVARTALAAWMEAVETVLGLHETAIEDIATNYEAHRVLTTSSVHGAADATNTLDAGTKAIATTLTTITDA